MAVGIKVWNDDGSLQFDSSARLSRTSAAQTTITAGSTGSVTVPNASEGTIWYSLLSSSGGSWYLPNLSVSGSTISWSPSPLNTPAVDVGLVYGTY